jgi:hypothetical protein
LCVATGISRRERVRPFLLVGYNTNIHPSQREPRTAGSVLSHQVRTLLGDGNPAYLDSNIPETVRIMQELISESYKHMEGAGVVS